MNFSSYHTPYYFIPNSGRPLPLRDGDVMWMGRNGCTALPQPSSFNHYTVYEKEMIRQAIINHEASFRYQVHELHRLHQRQKELMAEHRMREIAGNQVSYQRPQSDRLVYPIQPEPHVSSQLGDTYFQRPSFAGDSLQSDNNSFLAKLSRADNEVLPSHINGKRMIDLELPAHLYMQSDEEDMLSSLAKETREPNLESFQHNPFDTTGSLNIHSSCGGTKLDFDLNEPVQLDDDSYSSWSTQTVHLSPAPSREPVNESKASIGDNVVNVISPEEKKVEHQPLNSEAVEKSSAEGTSLGSNISCESHDSPKTVGSCISCSPQLVLHPADSDLKAISSVTSKKRSSSDSREVLLAVQALPCFQTTKVTKGPKSAYASSKKHRRLPKRMKNSHVDLNCMPLDLETEDYQAPHSSDFSSFDDNEESEDTFEVALYLPKEDKTGIGELDKLAAEAICSMSSSRGIMTPKPSGLLDNCLNWFAGIASSVSEDLCDEIKEHGNKSSGSDDRVLGSFQTRKARVRRTKDTFCKGKKQNEQKPRIVKETSLNTIDMGRKTDVAFDNIKRRKRNTGNSFSKRKNVGNCLHGWGLRTCRRKARRARRVFDDFLNYFFLYY